MKVLLVAVALACIIQVRGDGDKLRSLLNEKVKEHQEKKIEPSVFLDAGSSAVVLAEDPLPQCNALSVVSTGNELVKNTLDIFAETFRVVYTAMYPETGRASCTLGTFRCFLREFNDVKDSIQTVKNNIFSYRQKASGLTTGITDYLGKCLNN